MPRDEVVVRELDRHARFAPDLGQARRKRELLARVRSLEDLDDVLGHGESIRRSRRS